MSENPRKLLSIYAVLNGLYNDPRFIDQWTEGGRVSWGDETPLPQILPTLKSGVWTCDGIKCTPKISSLKCGVHGTWMMVIDDEGMYYAPILCLSRSKTADEDCSTSVIFICSTNAAAPSFRLPPQHLRGLNQQCGDAVSWTILCVNHPKILKFLRSFRLWV